MGAAADVGSSEPILLEALAQDPRDRLDKLVVVLLARSGRKESRAVVQRWIDRGRVLVNGRPGRAAGAVAVGAQIEVRPEPPLPSTAEPDPSVKLRVVFEDSNLLVIDKPAGLVVHPARGNESGTLVNGLLAHGGFELHAEAPDPEDATAHLRPGIVHRLDKGTSGLLVVAKDIRTREGLMALFAKHDVEREYVAIVVGRTNDATYDTLHARHPTDRLRFTSRGKTGRRAVTHVKVLERLGTRDAEATLVSCRLETGRTHQIRMHLAERAGTPVLGDPRYGTPPKSPLLRALDQELGHQALHARALGFVHPVTGESLRWELPLPDDMAGCLARLRSATKSSI